MVRDAVAALTGRVPLAGGRLITAPSPDDFPPFGSVLAISSASAASCANKAISRSFYQVGRLGAGP